MDYPVDDPAKSTLYPTRYPYRHWALMSLGRAVPFAGEEGSTAFANKQAKQDGGVHSIRCENAENVGPAQRQMVRTQYQIIK